MRHNSPSPFDQPKLAHGQFFYWWEQGILWISKGTRRSSFPLTVFEIHDLVEIFKLEERIIIEQYEKDSKDFGPRYTRF